MNILILAAGEQVQDPLRGEYPLFLSELNGELLIQRLISTLLPLKPSRFIFAVRKRDVTAHHIDDILRLIVPNCFLVEIGRETMGAACTALVAIDHFQLDEELIVTNATDLLDVNLAEVVEHFRASKADAGTIVFESLHPRYSYVRMDEGGFVVEAAEKRPISRNATAGFYWFAKARDFVESAQSMILKDAQVNGQFYICPSLNELVLKQKRILTWGIKPDQYHPLKAPQHVNALETMLDLSRVQK